MPGPFPGMDPWLENPDLWPDVHLGLIAGMRAILNQLLPPGYIARSEERCRILPIGPSMYPDVFLIDRPLAPGVTVSSGNAVMTPPHDLPRLIEESPQEPKEHYLDILHVATGYRVVTTIEVLSPTNKDPNSGGRQDYLKKQREILASETHLIEIDLLRAGQHTVAAPRKVSTPDDPWDYTICLHRGGDGKRYAVWAVPLRQRLPRIVIPLDAGVPEIVLDLQAIFDRSYDEGGYSRLMDYRGNPVPPLPASDAAWADALLRERGLRE
ncbi:MAG TPA: DUF4058 family protein [Chthonomonadaceae bacterium]|nr:DUF4058 family protein [Chthonomonadaceae bacterium]